MKTSNFEIERKKKIDIEENVKKMFENYKNNINPNNFDINKLSKEERKIIKGNKRYKPQKKKKKEINYDIKIEDLKDKKNKHLLMNSVNSIKKLNEKNMELKNVKNNHFDMDFKEKTIQNDWKNEFMISDAYLNNFKKGKFLDIKKIQNHIYDEVNDKNDIFNYMYRYDIEENDDKNKKENNNYQHPFLVNDDN
jgi:hypothetical protein